jgi:hypothetical protein
VGIYGSEGTGAAGRREEIGIPMLGDLLEEGLSAIGYSCNDYDLGHL